MGELASKEQLRMSFLRWAIVAVPAVVLLGFVSGNLAGSGAEDRWYQGLIKPALTPPGWVFGVAWTILYIMLGLVLAMLLHARGAKGRGLAIGLFLTQLLLNYLWSPLVFGAHQVSLGVIVIAFILILAVAATFAIKPIRKVAAWLMLPYLVWLGFATVLLFGIDRLNPDAETYVPPTPAAEILL